MRRNTPRARAFLISKRCSPVKGKGSVACVKDGLGAHAVGIIDVIRDEQTGVRVKVHAALVALLVPAPAEPNWAEPCRQKFDAAGQQRRASESGVCVGPPVPLPAPIPARGRPQRISGAPEAARPSRTPILHSRSWSKNTTDRARRASSGWTTPQFPSRLSRKKSGT